MDSNKKCCELVFGSHVAMGWGCCQSRHYNGLQRENCKVCGHERCAPLLIPADLKQAIYSEDGNRTKVEIVHSWFEDCGAWVTFNLRLRAIETLNGGMFGPIPNGTEFSVGTNVKYAVGSYGGWQLENIPRAKSEPRNSAETSAAINPLASHK
jgi:hypothetical protein